MELTGLEAGGSDASLLWLCMKTGREIHHWSGNVGIGQSIVQELPFSILGFSRDLKFEVSLTDGTTSTLYLTPVTGEIEEARKQDEDFIMRNTVGGRLKYRCTRY